MYHIHLTKAFVVDTIETKDDDVSLLILSKDLGLVWVYAYGLRKEKSKLRYTLRKGHHVECALVRGKAGWQVVNALLLDEGPLGENQYELLHRFHKIIKRIIPQADELGGYVLYHNLKQTLRVDYTEEVRQSALYLGVLNILDLVGYGIQYPMEREKDISYQFSEKNLSFVLQNQLKVNKDIAEALNASQL